MALKRTLTKAEWEKLEDGIRGLCSEKDGSYELQVEGVEDPAELKSALVKERQRASQDNSIYFLHSY